MIIIIDTREKKPLSFEFYNAKTVTKKLDTGDYSLIGYEKDICIERKMSISELYINFFKDYFRFRKELERMKYYQYKYVVCEFPYFHISSFPSYGIPSKNISSLNFNSEHIMNKIEHIKNKYGVEFVFCKDRVEATDKIFEILKDFYDQQ